MKILGEIDRDFQFDVIFSTDNVAAEPSVFVQQLEDIDREFKNKYHLTVAASAKIIGDNVKWYRNVPKKVIWLASCALVLILMAVAVFNGSFGQYSWFRMASGSMQREIPVGSLVIAKHVEPAEIRVGDTITFSDSDGRLVTHKIKHAFQLDGELCFQTQGTENADPDEEYVSKENLVGVVAFHFAEQGDLLVRLRTILLIMAAVPLILAVVLFWRGIAAKRKPIPRRYL